MSHFEQKTNTKTNGVALLVVALLAGSILYLGSTVAKDVSRETEQASAGIVAGVESVRQEATLSIIGGSQLRSYTFDLSEPATALDLVLRASQRENFSVETTAYDFGTIIDSIDGIAGGDQNRYWLYYVNNQQATVGADAYQVQPGDIVEFRYE